MHHRTSDKLKLVIIGDHEYRSDIVATSQSSQNHDVTRTRDTFTNETRLGRGESRASQGRVSVTASSETLLKP